MSDFAARRTTMVDTQVRPSDVTKFPIIDAMLSVPRELFVPDDRKEAAYVGEVLDVGGRIVLEPRTFAKMLDALDIGPTDMVLDLGCGLGYSTAVLAHMSEAVVGVEEDPAVAEDAQERLSEFNADNAAVLDGPLVKGAQKHGPYDVIIIEGGVETIPPSLLDQLRDGGRIAAIFLEGSIGRTYIGHMAGGKINWRYSFDANAPLLSGFEKVSEFQL